MRYNWWENDIFRRNDMAMAMLQNVCSQEIRMYGKPKRGCRGIPDHLKVDRSGSDYGGPVEACPPEVAAKYTPPPEKPKAGVSAKLKRFRTPAQVEETKRIAQIVAERVSSFEKGEGRIVLKNGMWLEHDIFGRFHVFVLPGGDHFKWYATSDLPGHGLIVRCMYSEFGLYSELTRNNATIKEVEK